MRKLKIRKMGLFVLSLCGFILLSTNALASTWSLGDLDNGAWWEIIYPVTGPGKPGDLFRAGSLKVIDPYTYEWQKQWNIDGLVLQSIGSSSLAGYDYRSVYDYGTLTLYANNALWGPEVTVNVSAVKYSIYYGEFPNFTNGAGANMDYYMEIFGEKDGLDYDMKLTFEGLWYMESPYYGKGFRSYDLGPQGDHFGYGFKEITLIIAPSSVPEPTTMLLLGLGLVGLAGVRKFRK